jgi:hypothetical protein
MNVYEIKTGLVDRVALLVIPEAEQTLDGAERFLGDGQTISWAQPPRLTYYAEPKKKALPRADISPFLPGSLVLNAKAVKALGGFLSGFGQLLPIDVDGETQHFFNATTVLPCIDRAASQTRPGGAVGKEAFIESAIPHEPTVFKCAETASTRLYANESARQALEEAAASAGVVGLLFKQAGL